MYVPLFTDALNVHVSVVSHKQGSAKDANNLQRGQTGTAACKQDTLRRGFKGQSLSPPKLPGAGLATFHRRLMLERHVS